MKTTSKHQLIGYDRSRSYDWNYDHVPEPTDLAGMPTGREIKFLGKLTGSPFGIAAGPLLNGKWILYYASLGFDILTYKTVRRIERPCYPLPNLLPVEVPPDFAWDKDRVLNMANEMKDSWAVSFGMPSRSPDVWRNDIEQTRRRLAPEKVLSVSVVATPEPDSGIDSIAEDYAETAEMAVNSGADVVEANFSCPNVDSMDGQLFQNPSSSGKVAKAIRKRIGDTPLIIKIGEVSEPKQIRALLLALDPYVQAVSLVNCLSAKIKSREGDWCFDGDKRGIAGELIADSVRQQVETFLDIKKEDQYSMEIIAVGGITRTDQVLDYLNRGVHAVHVATAAMLNPTLALEVKQGLSQSFRV